MSEPIITETENGVNIEIDGVITTLSIHMGDDGTVLGSGFEIDTN